jgi:hypothetical protein
MRIAFVCDNFPLTDNLNGASALNYSHLRVLLRAVPGTPVHLVVLDHYAGLRFEAAKIIAEFGESAITVTRINFGGKTRCKGNKAHLLGWGTRPLHYFYPFLTGEKIAELGAVLRTIGPDLIWTEHLIANLATLASTPRVPVVYGHHDLLWKVASLRNAGKSWKKRLLNHAFRRAELQLIRANAFVAGGSQTELAEIRRVQPAAVTAFLPAAYAPVLPLPLPPVTGIRVVHLGSLAATANRIGLERFLRVCWPPLHGQFPTLECLVIGDLGATPSAALTELLGQPGVRSLGYVPDLTQVLHPYDVFVIPYEHDTGTRTRLPVGLNHNQLLVAHKNACKGIPGLRHLENCLLADSLEEMTALIAQVLAGKIAPQPIAGRGRQFFEEAFTVEGQLPRLKSFLSGIFGG